MSLPRFLGLGAKGMASAINIGLDREERRQDRASREATAAANRAHDLN